MSARQTKAVLLALTAIFFWSTMATAFKLALAELDFLNLLVWSSFFSLTGLGLVLTFQGKWKDVPEAAKKGWKWSVLLGFLNPFLYYFILFQAYDVLPAQEAMALNYTWPVMLALLSIPLLRQRMSLFGIIAVLISFGGILVISTHGDLLSFRFTNPVGDSMAIGSSIVWAVFWIYNVRSRVDPVVQLFLNFVPGLFLSLIALWISDHSLTIPGTQGLVSTVYIGLFEMGITFMVWLTALRLTTSTHRISQLVFLSPFLSLVWIRIFVGEHILPATITGLILVVGGIILNQWKGKAEKA